MTIFIDSNRGTTVGELLETLRLMLLPVHGKEESTALIYRLLEYFLKLNHAGVILERKHVVGVRKQVAIIKAARKLVENMPLQYVTGEAYFGGLTLNVNRFTLIPRPETEEMTMMVMNLLKNKPPRRIIDIGTGSGCIAITLKKQFADSQTYAIDISKNALKLAWMNAEHNNTRVEFFCGDILDVSSLPAMPAFDLIISNPPYVRNSEKIDMKPNVLNFEPHKALFVPDRIPLKFYRAIGKFARQNLAPGGMLVFEVNERLGQETAALLRSQGFVNTDVRRDFRGKERFVIAQ